MSMNGKSFNLFHNATTQIKNLLSPDATGKGSANACLIHPQPSTIDDTNDCPFDSNGKKADELLRREPDLCEEERFRACFIDCCCDCSAKKITQGRVASTSELGIFEQMLRNLRSSNYDVLCDCRCGDNEQRAFTFNYSAGQPKRAV